MASTRLRSLAKRSLGKAGLAPRPKGPDEFPPLWDWDNRRRLVSELAPGRSFLDLGGMWGIGGDVAFWAEKAGGTDVLLFDGMDPSQEFVRKHDELSSKVRFRQGDLHDLKDVRLLESWDVVWCAGVIYHSPDPFRLLLHLRSITKETLLIGSHIVPEVPGYESACIFYPGRSEAAVSAASIYHVNGNAYPGIEKAFDKSPAMGYANNWWGITLTALRAMMQFAGFEIVSEDRYTPITVDIVAKLGPEPEFIPEQGFSRERGRALVRAFPDEDRPSWWEIPDTKE